MNVGNRRPGSSTVFVDSASDEEILQFAADHGGQSFMAFHLYDATGSFVAGSPLEHFGEGVTIRGGEGEVLLGVPPDPAHSMTYRLYNSQGCLLTTSDGARTMIYPLLRMEGVKRDWVLPAPCQPVLLQFPSPPSG